jgi:GNAT superfamily N-acetyltransferase
VDETRFRPIEPEDAAALVRFHERLSDETTRMRFFSPHPHLTPAEVDRFCRVDHHDREALVATHGDDIVGVGRYDRTGGPHEAAAEAEVAFVVADGCQGQGIGAKLLEQLATRARTQGITRFVADTFGENYRMRAVFRASGLVVESDMDAGVLHVVLDLSAEAPATPTRCPTADRPGARTARHAVRP